MRILIRGCNELDCTYNVYISDMPQCGLPVSDVSGRFDTVHEFDYDGEEGKLHCVTKET